MKIFKELNKLGYKHYTEHTVEELDDLPLDSEERIMEQALVLRWFRDKYNIDCNVEPIGINKRFYSIYICFKNNSEIRGNGNLYETYEEAELDCLNKLIEIVKNGKD